MNQITACWGESGSGPGGCADSPGFLAGASVEVRACVEEAQLEPEAAASPDVTGEGSWAAFAQRERESPQLNTDNSCLRFSQILRFLILCNHVMIG